MQQQLKKLFLKNNFIRVFVCCLLFVSCKRTEVEIKVKADFVFEVADSNYSVPTRIAFTNKSAHAQFYKWTFEGGSPAAYDKRDPGAVAFTTAGAVKIKLEVWSDQGRDEKEITIVLDSMPHAAFTVMPVINNYGATTFVINNTSGGGVTKFNWLFTGATPASSSLKNPDNIKITNPGDYRLFLTAFNDKGRKDTVSKWVKVLPALQAAFDIIPFFDDEDGEAPLRATLQNNTVSATSYNWLAPGGVLSNATDTIPTVLYTLPGTYTITYKAGNGKDSVTINKTITVKPNTGLRTFNNIKLGINTAQVSVGNYFSTILRTVIRKDEVNSTNGHKIDIVFYGLNELFSYNLFVSPVDAKAWTFAAIPGATATKIINTQELCACGANFTATDFDNVNNGNAFNTVQVTVTNGGIKEFNNTVLPRVVLFENSNGKKGAIKIKQFVKDGINSYVVCDIKVQKD